MGLWRKSVLFALLIVASVSSISAQEAGVDITSPATLKSGSEIGTYKSLWRCGSDGFRVNIILQSTAFQFFQEERKNGLDTRHTPVIIDIGVKPPIPYISYDDDPHYVHIDFVTPDMNGAKRDSYAGQRKQLGEASRAFTGISGFAASMDELFGAKTFSAGLLLQGADDHQIGSILTLHLQTQDFQNFEKQCRDTQTTIGGSEASKITLATTLRDKEALLRPLLRPEEFKLVDQEIAYIETGGYGTQQMDYLRTMTIQDRCTGGDKPSCDARAVLTAMDEQIKQIFQARRSARQRR